MNTATPTAPGSRLEQLRVILMLVLDLASVPFHVIVFLATRRQHRARFAATLEEHRS